LEDKTVNKKSRSGFMVIAGGYLLYTGYQLMQNVLKNEPDHTVVFMIAGILFMVIGVLTIIYYVRAMMKAEPEEDMAEEDNEDTEEENEAGVPDKIEASETPEIEEPEGTGEPEECPAEDASK